MEDNGPLRLLLTRSTVLPGRLVPSYNGARYSNCDSFSLPIAESTIVLGARYLMKAKDLIRERYSDVVNVVYGDTDSVFLRTADNVSVAEAIK